VYITRIAFSRRFSCGFSFAFSPDERSRPKARCGARAFLSGAALPTHRRALDTQLLPPSSHNLERALLLAASTLPHPQAHASKRVFWSRTNTESPPSSSRASKRATMVTRKRKLLKVIILGDSG
jgi:hypothetical protein